MNKYERIPEYILDLHGHTTREAKELLDELLEEEYKHVRIITGKGQFRETGPVMRNFVEQYLRLREIKFENAKLNNGREGAFEDYLK